MNCENTRGKIMVLEEFDDSRTAIFNPADANGLVEGMPRVAVTCFSQVTFKRLLEELKGVPIAESHTANMIIPIYKAAYRGVEIALYLSDVGAPACIGLAEEVFVMGVEKIVMFGTCGVLDGNIGDCSVIIPDSAVRDEGTSYHYAPPGDEIPVNVKYRDEFEDILKKLQCSYTVGKTWTTDAIFRETREKMRRRKEQGCICVDMECSAMAALAQFRGRDVFQFFYAADNLDSEVWDIRSLSNEANVLEKDKIAMLAMELALKIS